MPFYFKPVVWNGKGYRGPAGERFTSGFPHENGYGHEEWNNAPEFSYVDGSDRFKVFHTEGLGLQDLDEQAGLIALMLIASHAGKQWLVGVAAGCMPLASEDQKAERLRLAERLGLDSDAMASQTWALRSVQTTFGNDERVFRKAWNKDFHWIPNWTCPADLYLPLFEPVALNAEALTGKKRLVAMYGSYQPVDQSIFQRVLGRIPSSAGQQTIDRLKAWAGGDTDASQDIKDIRTSSTTVRAALIQARIGQGAYRAEVMSEWDSRCAVTGSDIGEMLRASHVQPWKASSNDQRLDAQNGLILAAHLDALFDRGLISFDDDGDMLVAPSIRGIEPEVWGVGSALRRKPKGRLVEYLNYHRKSVYCG